MITEDYVSFETAKLLKEKGFDEKVDTLYKTDAEFLKSNLCINYNDANFRLSDMHNIPENTVSAPTLQMAMKWLREVHNLYINIFVTWKDKIPHYQWSIDNLITQDTIYDTPCSEKYEEACEAAIEYCLKNLI